MKKARLGRGLDALLGGSTEDDAKNPDELKQLPVDLLQRGKYQPRHKMDDEALEELAQSVKAQGVVQPIVVRGIDAGKYEIIAGERRWRAAQMAGLHTIPAVIRQVPDKTAMAVALIENIQRENLSPLEEAEGLRRLLDEFGLTHQQVAESIGRSRTTVTNLLRLLSLGKVSRDLLQSGQLDMGHARTLLALTGPPQDEAAGVIVSRELSVRQAERLVKRLQQADPDTPSKRQTDPDILRLQEKLSDRLGAELIIRDRGGKGKLTIRYNSLDELDGIISRIR